MTFYICKQIFALHCNTLVNKQNEITAIRSEVIANNSIEEVILY
jgi:hypothetical protein